MTSMRAASQALNNLAKSARMLRELAESQAMRATMTQCQEVADTLAAAREQLHEDGPDYLDAAEAFVRAGARELLVIAVAIGTVHHARA